MRCWRRGAAIPSETGTLALGLVAAYSLFTSGRIAWSVYHMLTVSTPLPGPAFILGYAAAPATMLCSIIGFALAWPLGDAAIQISDPQDASAANEKIDEG